MPDLASVYDLSACDILEGGVDVLWSEGVLYLDADLPLPTWAYVVTAAVVFFLVISLGQNIGQILGDKEAATQPWFTEVLCLGQCVLLLFLTDPRRVWVADHDREMLVLTSLYIALYLTRHAFSLVMEGHVYTLNVITATLILVTARLYCSFETPYCTVFLLLLMTRLAHKLFAQPSSMDRLTMVADALYLSLHYRLSYRPSFWDPQVIKNNGIAVFIHLIRVSTTTGGPRLPLGAGRRLPGDRLHHPRARERDAPASTGRAHGRTRHLQRGSTPAYTPDRRP
jgi:hypothetical protein